MDGELSREIANGIVDNETLMEFVKSRYVIGRFVSKLDDYVEEGNFIQEGVSYRKELQ